jgi:hypothetical protein
MSKSFFALPGHEKAKVKWTTPEVPWLETDTELQLSATQKARERERERERNNNNQQRISFYVGI